MRIAEDLWAWADAASVNGRPQSAIIGFPMVRNRRLVDALACLVADLNDARAAIRLRREVHQLIAERVRAGVPPEIAERDGRALQRAVWIRLNSLPVTA